jgi:Tfp pilus tip-associated adhesin PilY1
MIWSVYTGSGLNSTEDTTGRALFIMVLCSVDVPSIIPSVGVTVQYTVSPETKEEEKDAVVSRTGPPLTVHAYS